MGLLVCPDCDGKLSDAALSCPHYGRPNSSSISNNPVLHDFRLNKIEESDVESQIAASKKRRKIAFALDFGLIVYGTLGIEYVLGGSRNDYSSLVAVGIGLSYLLIKDCLFGGASLGKRICKLKVIEFKTGQQCDFVHSFKRNGVVVGLVTVACLFTMLLRVILGDQIAASAGAIAIIYGVFHSFSGVNAPDGRTNSDITAGTWVVSSKN